MLDTYLISRRPTTTYINQTVHEERAPTDESVRLLKEMEEKADAKRISVMQMPGNEFRGVVERWFEAQSGCEVIRAVFDLNGKRCTAEVKQFKAERPDELLIKLWDEVSKVVAREILVETTRNLRIG